MLISKTCFICNNGRLDDQLTSMTDRNQYKKYKHTSSREGNFASARDYGFYFRYILLFIIAACETEDEK